MKHHYLHYLESKPSTSLNSLSLEPFSKEEEQDEV